MDKFARVLRLGSAQLLCVVCTFGCSGSDRLVCQCIITSSTQRPHPLCACICDWCSTAAQIKSKQTSSCCRGSICLAIIMVYSRTQQLVLCALVLVASAAGVAAQFGEAGESCNCGAK